MTRRDRTRLEKNYQAQRLDRSLRRENRTPPAGKFLTLFTDASFAEARQDAARPPGTTRNRAAYGVWAKFCQETFRYAGMIKGEPSGSGEAELAALVNGLYLVLRRWSPSPGVVIIAQTDCEEVLRIMENRQANLRGRKLELQQYAHEMLRHAGVQVRFRHVKGHQGHKTPRSSVNTWVDGAARDILTGRRTLEAIIGHQVEFPPQQDLLAGD